MKRRLLQAGFTIIELLVVIAIIVVLAAIVVAYVSQYIPKSQNAAIKANLATVITNGAVWIDTWGDFGSHGGFTYCTSANFTTPQSSITKDGGASLCNVSTSPANTNFCACSTLNTTSNDPSGSVFCVDSSGVKKEVQVGGMCVGLVCCTMECATPSALCQ